MSGFFGSKPKPPDPYKVADAQTQSNIKTAQEQARLAMSGISGPTGDLTWVTDPSSPSGYRQVQTMTPEEQALMGQSQDLQAQYGGVAGEQLGRVGDTMATPFSMDAARAKVLADMNREFLDPQWQSREEALKNDLMNRGLREGDTNWADIMRDFEGSRSKAYDQMFLDSYDKANNAALLERNLPLMDLASLRTGAFPMGWQAGPTGNNPTPGVAATDIASLVNNAYQGQVAQANAGKGALGGLGSSAIMAYALSDRRTKTEAIRIGDDPRGWGVYRFKYILDEIKGDAEYQLGFMADEVEKVRPEAVYTMPETGTKMINYELLAQ